MQVEREIMKACLLVLTVSLSGLLGYLQRQC